ncbi:MAG: hypothetical protein HZB56_10495 [Deltaproteobacteria bacterium]|nr:hypothetical protein [Deltaproteobacteria bacterium]
MRSLTPLWLLLAGCATSAPSGKEPFPAAPPARPATSAAPAPGSGLAAAPASYAGDQGALAAPAPAASEVANPRAFAARYPRPDLCEGAARSVQGLSRDKAWEVLRACVDRGGFTHIKRLLDGTWDKELTTKPDAAQLIAKVVAQRGGDVYGDLNRLRQRRIPLFGLGPAVTHPELYRGRLLLVRAMVERISQDKGKVSARLMEYALSGSLKDVPGSEKWVRSHRSGSAGSVNRSPSGSTTWSSGHASETSWGTERTQRTENTPTETGLEAIGKLQSVDPFFEPGRQFVILARFDGVRDVPTETEEGEGESQRTAILSLVAYVEPSPVIVE